jgi:hypothetical protein
MYSLLRSATAAPCAVRAKYAYCAAMSAIVQLDLPLPEDGGERERQQDRRERQLQVDDAHDQRLGSPAQKGRCRAERGAQAQRDQPRGDGNLQRDLETEEDGGKHVAPLRVGSQPMDVAGGADEARWAARVPQRQFREVVRVLRRDQRREHRQQYDEHDDAEGGDRDAVLAELAPENGERGRAILHDRALRSRGSRPT